MRRGMLPLAAALAAGSPAAASAADEPSWNCRASIVRVTATTLPTIEPLAANVGATSAGTAPRCAPDYEGLPELHLGQPAGGDIRLQGPMAATDLTPAAGAARDQTATATARAADVRVSLGGGQLVITATALRAQAQARCVNGQAAFPEPSSTVAGLAINGVPVVADGPLIQVSQVVNGSPLNVLVRIRLHQREASATGVVQQAARIELLTMAGAPQATIVLGEAQVSTQGATCGPSTGDPGGPVTTPGGGTGTTGTGTTGSGSGTTGSGTGGDPTTSGAGGAGTPVVINGANGGCGRLAMWFSKVTARGTTKGHPRKATSRFGTRVVLRGVLRSCTGKPISGARLDVVHSFAGRSLAKTGLKSRSGGRVTLILPENLASRALSVRYRGNLATRRVTSRQTLRLTVRDRRGHVLKAPPRRSLKEA